MSSSSSPASPDKGSLNRSRSKAKIDAEKDTLDDVPKQSGSAAASSSAANGSPSGGRKGHGSALPIPPLSPEEDDKEIIAVKENVTDLPIHVPESAWKAYREMLSLTKDLNLPVDMPEWVVVGPRGSGKSSVVNGILGWPVSSLSVSSTQRYTIIIYAVHAVGDTKITIGGATKTFPAAAEYGSCSADVQAWLNSQIESLANGDSPVIVRLESSHVWTTTIYDTPGLKQDKDGTISSGSTADAVIGHAAPSNRRLIVVEEAAHARRSAMLPWVRTHLDPSLTRTTVVLTHLREALHVSSFGEDSPQVEKWSLFRSAPPCPTFYVSLASHKVLQSFEVGGKTLRSIRNWNALATARDLQWVANLNPSSTSTELPSQLLNLIGMDAVMQHYLVRVWRDYHARVPGLLAVMDGMKRRLQEDSLNVKRRAASFGPLDVRSAASRYVRDVLEALQLLMTGSARGLPSLTGQTSTEERELNPWMDSRQNVLTIQSNWVPFLDMRLYGSQQFERLVREFQAVITHLDGVKASSDAIASVAAGRTVYECAWIASDLVRAHAEHELAPLISRLFDRIYAALRRNFDVATTCLPGMVASESGPFTMREMISECPFFTHSVTQWYEELLEDVVVQGREKCEDDVGCLKHVQWNSQSSSVSVFANLKSKDLTTTNSKGNNSYNISPAVLETVQTLSEKLWDDIRSRVSQSVVLKCHEYVFLPLEQRVSVELHGRLARLSDEDVEALFRADAVRKSWAAQIDRFDRMQVAHENRKKGLVVSLAQFTPPPVVPS